MAAAVAAPAVHADPEQRVSAVDGGLTPAAAVAESQTKETAAATRTVIRTKRLQALVGGAPMEVIVQEFSNSYVVMATQLQVPGACFHCQKDHELQTVGTTYTVMPVLGGRDDPLGTVVARQLMADVGQSAKAQGRDLILYVGIDRRLAEDDPSSVIRETITAVQRCKLW
eukprot:TRINITY_DN14382_c0_g1_i1.p1 TRINITY_DN14382_c0_g1~~TRINITY_DN14382_c0_g1_i1.p1  ORF type:complete len:193 (+),score=37.40 TRINITY_DN14382_c0_g1_i1:72-581(+)